MYFTRPSINRSNGPCPDRQRANPHGHSEYRGAAAQQQGRAREVLGPFPNPEHLIAGFWLIQVASKEEAIEWVKRCPNPMPGESEIEIRQVFEAEDFGPALTPELRAAEERMRTATGR